MRQDYRQPGLGLIALACFLFLAVMPAGQLLAQAPIQILEQDWETNFRDQLIFNLRAENSTEITEVNLFYRVVGQLATSRNEAEFTPGTAIDAEFTIDQTDSSGYFPPGTELEFWWKVIDADGQELKTERETLLYIDERYDWQTLQNERLTLYWYSGSPEFGQALFERANVALDTLQSDIGIALEEPIKIFIYANHQDLLGALSVTAQEWTGGVAFAQYGVVVLGINPRQLDWGLNAMTHEMSHLVIHQATDNPFAGLPRWLDEGIAVYNENRDELDDDFRPLFEQAVNNDELMTLRTLSSPFPADAREANLAYGQSGAVVKFVVDTYGSQKMAELLDIFAEGAIPDEALEQSLGVDMLGLDNTFRESLGLAPWPGSEIVESDAGNAENAVSEESADTETSEDKVTEEAVVVEVVPTANSAEPETVSDTPTEPAESTRSALSFLPCVGGVLALLVLGGALYGVRLR